VRRLVAVDKYLDILKVRRIDAIARQQAEEAAREEQKKADRDELARQNLSEFMMSGRKRPEPQPYGVSNEGAEHYVASWLEYLGQVDVSITTFSGDGGVDVLSRDYVCQVKNYRSGPVSVSEVRDLFGTAVSEGRKAVLFTSSSVTQQGVEFADKNQVALVRFLPPDGRLDAINFHGIRFLNDGNYDSE
jgi:restriction endonuclease Mrr